MPHILVEGYNIKKNIKCLNIHAEITFSNSYYHSFKRQDKLSELELKITNLVKEYFEESEIVSDNISLYGYRNR